MFSLWNNGIRELLFFCWQLDDCRVGTVQQLWGMKVLIYEKQDSLSDLKNDMCSTSCIIIIYTSNI